MKIEDTFFADVRYRYEVLGSVEIVINLINEQPDLIARRKDLREFLIDIVTGKSKPASKHPCVRLPVAAFFRAEGGWQQHHRP